MPQCDLTNEANIKCVDTMKSNSQLCRCTHVKDIQPGQTYQFIFLATGNYHRLWNFGHPVHLHDHSFRVAKIGFGEYNNGHLTTATDAIECEGAICSNPKIKVVSELESERGTRLSEAPLRDTILVPAGGYAVVYFTADNLGYWFLHCHIKVHQLEGMAVVISNDGKSVGQSGMDKCSGFTWKVSDFTWESGSSVALVSMLSIMISLGLSLIMSC